MRRSCARAPPLRFGGYCPVTYYDGKGSRDWDAIVEADPVHVVQYRRSLYGFATLAHKMTFMRSPATYVGLALPAKRPPKMAPVSMAQLKRGGLHGVLAVAEQSLSVATQEALVHCGQHRLKFPSLGVGETAAKLFGLYLKSTNPSRSAAVRDRYRRKMDTFVQECRLVEYLQEHQEVMQGTPRGSGTKAVRGVRGEPSPGMAEYVAKARQFEMLCGEKSSQLHERYLS